MALTSNDVGKWTQVTLRSGVQFSGWVSAISEGGNKAVIDHRVDDKQTAIDTSEIAAITKIGRIQV